MEAGEIWPNWEQPVTVYGLFGSPSGLGKAARLLADNLEDVGRHVCRIDVTPHLSGTPIVGTWPDKDPGKGVLIFHLNPVEMAEIMARLSPSQLRNRYRIGVWLYETDPAPEHWKPYRNLIDAVWTPGRSSHAALSSIEANPVLVPYRHKSPVLSQNERKNGNFEVLTIADYNSSLARKNVHGAVSAFRMAFGNDTECRLTLKLSNLPPHHDLHAFQSPQIRILEETLSEQETLQLIHDADALLSLHRAEGYGLPVIEALLCGTPVIATDEPSLPDTGNLIRRIRAETVSVSDPQRIYAGGQWFDASVTHAADLLRGVRSEDEPGKSERRANRQNQADQLLCGSDRLDPLKTAIGRHREPGS